MILARDLLLVLPYTTNGTCKVVFVFYSECLTDTLSIVIEAISLYRAVQLHTLDEVIIF